MDCAHSCLAIVHTPVSPTYTRTHAGAHGSSMEIQGPREQKMSQLTLQDMEVHLVRTNAVAERVLREGAWMRVPKP